MPLQNDKRLKILKILARTILQAKSMGQHASLVDLMQRRVILFSLFFKEKIFTVFVREFQYFNF
jgi:hypothetical protein